MSPQKHNVSSPKKNSEEYTRVILDLKLKGLSLNEIRDHLKICHSTLLSIRTIRNKIINYGEKAKKINQYYDNKVFPRIQVAEADEIYQGRETMHIGIVDKSSSYLVALTQVESKANNVFLDFFKQYRDSFPSLQAFITDGLTTYNAPMDSIFKKQVHIRCHVHAYRDLMNEQDKFNLKANRKYGKLKQEKDHLIFIRNRIVHNQLKVLTAQNRLDNAIKIRDENFKRHNLPKYSKYKKHQKIRQKFQKDVGYYRSYKRTYQQAVQSWKKKRKTSEKKILELDIEYKKAKTISLQSGRLVARFKDLLDCSWRDFDEKKAKLGQILLNSPYPIAKRINQILKNKTKIFNDKNEHIQGLLPPNRVNTNTIESIFGRYRLFFRKYRTITHSRYSQAVFNLLRLHHNLSSPYTGPNRDISPIIRARIKTKFNNALDCLCGAGGRY